MSHLQAHPTAHVHFQKKGDLTAAKNLVVALTAPGLSGQSSTHLVAADVAQGAKRQPVHVLALVAHVVLDGIGHLPKKRVQKGEVTGFGSLQQNTRTKRK